MIKSNIWKYYLYRIFGAAVFTMPIWVLYLQENGLSLTEVMLLQTVYTITMLIFTIPFGALADLWERKKVLIISQIGIITGYFTFFSGDSFWWFLLGEVFLGISTASYFGIQEAFLYDTLKQIKESSRFKKVVGNVYAINDVMMGTVGIFGAAIAALISMRFTFGISIIPLVIAFLICFSFKEPKHKKQLYEKGYFQHIKESLIFSWEHKDVRFIIIFGMIIGSFSFLTYFLYQIYFIELGIKIEYIGILYAILFALSALGAKLCHSVENKLKEKYTSILIIAIPALCFLVIAFTKTWVGIPFALFVWLVSASFRATFINDYINKHLSSHHRATILTINNMIGSLFFAIISPILGRIGDVYSIRSVFMVMGLVLVGYLGYLLWYFRK